MNRYILRLFFMTTLYGINNCDTIKKAKCWLEENGINYSFHDYKKAGIDKTTLKNWCGEFGWEALFNKRGTTWRKLDENLKADINPIKAIALMHEHTSLIKRPVLISGNQKLLGFDEKSWQSLI